MHSTHQSRLARTSTYTGSGWLRGATSLAVWGLLLLVLALVSGCGDAADNPDDCTSVEYFNDATKLCTACPAAVVPSCEPGCGFEIVPDENSCPVAECASECRCEEGEFFSEDNLSCVSCEEASLEILVCGA